MVALPDAYRSRNPGAARSRGARAASIAAWLHIDEGGRVHRLHRQGRVGQNIRTSLAQAVADELHVRAAVSLVMADTDLTPYDAGTFGSQSTPRMAPVWRVPRPTAREILVDHAAALWQLDRTDGHLQGRPDQRQRDKSAGYGELAKGQKLAGMVPADAPVFTGQ